MSYAVEVAGGLDVAALESALLDVAIQHEPLRTTYVNKPRLLARVHRQTWFEVSRWASKDVCEQTAIVEMERRRPIDIAEAPPIRVGVIHCERGRDIVLLTFHHICADGWSLAIFCRALSKRYEVHKNGLRYEMQNIGPQCIEHAHWLNQWTHGSEATELCAWWRDQQDRCPWMWETKAVATHLSVATLDRLVLALRPEIVDRIEAVSRQHGVSVFVVLHAAYCRFATGRFGGSIAGCGTLSASRHTTHSQQIMGAHYNGICLCVNTGKASDLIDESANVIATALDRDQVPYCQYGYTGGEVESLRVPLISFQADQYPVGYLRFSGATTHELYLDSTSGVGWEVPVGTLWRLRAIAAAGASAVTLLARQGKRRIALSIVGVTSPAQLEELLSGYVAALTDVIDLPMEGRSPWRGKDGPAVSVVDVGDVPTRIMKAKDFSPVEALSPFC